MMLEVLTDIFGSYGRIIIFLHIISASLLLGSMLVMIFVVRPVISYMDDEILKYRSCLKIIKKYFYFLIPVMLILVSASVFMNVGMGFEYGNPVTFIMIHIKESIWLFMVFNFIYMFIKYINAKKALEEKDLLVTQENIVLITKYLMPLNLLLGMIAVYFGVIIRGY